MQLYAITDRSLLPASGDGSGPRGLGALARSWAAGGVAFIQVREKDLSVDELAAWSEAVVKAVQGTATKVLINGTPRSAHAVGADGIHLPAGWTAEAIRAARNVFEQSNRQTAPAIVSVACHSDAEAVRARDLGADLALLSPVFEKRLRQPGTGTDSDRTLGATRVGMGLTVFRESCRLAAPLPVFALGGVTTSNARQCVEAGAVGVAAIRLFMGKDAGWRVLAQKNRQAKS
jgi:thiamine-phosphate pyrophosphorylase